MITIENEEDIKLLIEFFRRFNVQIQKEDEKSSSIETEIKEINLNLAEISQRLFKLEKQQVSPSKQIKESEHQTTQNTIRQYTKKTYKELPKIKKVTKDGKLIVHRGRTLIYNISDLQRLNQFIDSDLTFSELSAKFGFSNPTIRVMCCGLETGHFDKWINLWNAQYNHLPSKNVPVVNNPEKRKELAGMG